MLQARDIAFAYKDIRVLQSVDVQVPEGRVVCVVGPNGAGKSTLLRCIAGVHRPRRGSILIDGADPWSLSRRQLARRLAYLPQALLFRFPVSVFETVLSGRRPYFSWRPSRRDMEKVHQVLEALDLGSLAHRDMDRLSGGQRQKVLLARALVQETPYLVLDEPTAGLDLRHQLEILETVRKQAQQEKVGVLMALHDLNLAARFSHRILVLHRGGVAARGSPEETITAENIRKVYGVEAKVARENGCLHVHVIRCSRRDRRDPVETPAHCRRKP
ncbi:MAG: ABC transporter ATP-binding protein [Desulfacinum sp.]|jgi:iron complex transport system ATP-binding protein|nr:ABC transporter ATP-binding protein [Desulfacinum sp.]MBZ4658085.1 transporter ATP-binding protein [Desulfacinum sp.]